MDTASTLVREANLGSSITSISSQHPTKFRYSTNLTPVRTRLFASPSTPARNNSNTNNTAEESPSMAATTPNPIKLVKKTPRQTQLSTPTPQNSRLQKQWSNEVSVVRPVEEPLDQTRVTLDSIITQYLTNQHALCKNPIATCPQFNLFVPHKCPDPKPKLVTGNNFVMRYAGRQLGYQSKSMDMRFVHSRYCPIQTIRPASDDEFFTCAKFLPGRNSVIVGDYNGDVRTYNMVTGNEENMFNAHDNFVTYMEPNRTGELLLTCSSWGRPLSGLWGLENFDLK